MLSSGGVRGAIAETAEAVFTDQFNHEQQVIARRIFLRLTELSDETASADTRRRATFTELILKPEDALATQTVLKALADARLITTSEDAAEVAHEALIREWPTLRGWLEDNREALRLHRHLTEAAQEWSARNRESDMFYRGTRLTQAREWAESHNAEMNPLESEFLTASVEFSGHETREREAQRQRELEAAQKLAQTEKARAEEQAQSARQLSKRAQYLTGAFIIALVMALTALFFGSQARQAAVTAQNEASARATQQSIAEANFTHAEAQCLAAEATNLINTKGSSDTAALLTLRSLNLEYTPQGDAALLSAINLNYPLQTFTGNTDIVTQVAFSPDDQYILTGSRDGTVRLFNAQSGEQLQIFSGHTAAITDIAFSSDGKWALTGSDDFTVRLWEVATGEQIRIYAGHTNIINMVAFSRDGTQILTGSEDNTLRVWDIETGRELNQWSIQEPVSAFSSDGSYAVGYSETDNANHLWDMRTLTKTYSFGYSGPPLRYAASFSPDGKYLLAAYGKEIVLSDVASGKEIQVFKGHTDGVLGVEFSPDGKYILSSSFDGTARLWDIKTGQEVRRFSGQVASVAFSSDGKKILTGGAYGSVLLWNIEPRLELPAFDAQNDLYGIAFSPDGRYLATNVISNELRLWDISSGQTLWSAQDSGLALWALAFSPDGKYVINGNMDGVATLWDAKTGKEVHQFTAQGLDEIYGLAFSPDGKTVVAAGFSWTSSGETFAPIWDIETGKEILRLPLPAHIYKASFSPDGKYILTDGGAGISQLWDAQTGTNIRGFDGGSAIYSPNGKYAVTVDGPTGFIWDIQTGQEIRRFEGPADGIGFLAYSPDGKFIAAANGSDVRLWDAQTGQELRRYPHSAPANLVDFSPDSQFLASISTDGIARFFDVDYHTTMKYLCSILLRDFTDEERAQYNIKDNTPTCPKP